MLKIHYLSCHAILEYDEVSLLTELGYEVYSNGVYRDPKGSYTLPRPGIKNGKFDQQFFDFTAQFPKTDLPAELIEPYDIIMVMHTPEWIINNWEKIKHKRVIWRSIGQSTSSVENSLARMREEGLQVVRYSPKEKNIPNYIGQDALIRFYKDPEEFKGWTGTDKRPINFTQSLKGRKDFCHYDEIMGSLMGHDGAKVYGTGNDDLGSFNGGEVTYEKLKELLRQARVFVYGGTWPACYTLGFIEAMMTGTPIVAVSKLIAENGRFENLHFYEVDEIIQNGVNGFVCDSIAQMRETVEQLLTDDAFASKISASGRERAIQLFGKKHIAKQWKEFLDKGVSVK
jgi:glycosyltransferase involved in cell wall biosynthesis